MRKIIGILIALAMLITGCTQTSLSAGESLEPPPELNEQTWISPGKVEVGRFHPGARAEWPLIIHNGKSEPAQFEVRYREPTSVDEGHIKAPGVVQDWVIIADPTPLLDAFETREVLVVLEMPEEIGRAHV